MGDLPPTRASRARKNGETRMIPDDQRDEPGDQPDHAAAVPRRARDGEQDEPDDEGDHAGNQRAVDLAWRRRAPGQGTDHRHAGDGAGGVAGGEEGRDDREHHGRHDHVPRQGEHPDEVVRVLLVGRAVGEPHHQAQHEAHDGPDDPDDDAVGLQDEPDVAVGRPHGLEHAEGAHAALGQHGEAADRHEGDEEHADGRQRQHDGRRVDDVVVVRARRRDVGQGRFLVAEGDASKRTLTSVGCVTCPGGTSANSSSRLWGFCTMPTTVLPPWGHVSPTRRLSSDAKPGVRAISFGPVG